MIDKEKIRAEVERLLNKEWRLADSTEGKYRREAYKEIIGYIDSLPEETSEDERIRKELRMAVTIAYNYSYFDAKTMDDCIAWLEKQGEQKEYTFKSLPRLLDMIEPTDRAKSYCQKLMDSLSQEGYATDAKIVGDCLKQMKGEKVAMATMDEQKPTEWSAEDECYLAECINAIATKDGWSFEEKRKTRHWLDSLKERIQNQ